jgi:chaperonin GroEL
MRNPNLYDLQRENIKNRLAKLSGGVAVIKVGGSTESEMRERKDRVEDAINAVKSAIQEGIVPGGGSALLHCTKALDSISTDNLLPEEVIGIDIVRRSIRAPFQQILTNAGVEYHQFMHMIVDGSARCGYDALRGKFVEDMVSAGIIDPTKVVRSALEHAASASGTLLTTEVTIFDLLEEPTAKQS